MLCNLFGVRATQNNGAGRSHITNTRSGSRYSLTKLKEREECSLSLFDDEEIERGACRTSIANNHLGGSVLKTTADCIDDFCFFGLSFCLVFMCFIFSTGTEPPGDEDPLATNADFCADVDFGAGQKAVDWEEVELVMPTSVLFSFFLFFFFK